MKGTHNQTIHAYSIVLDEMYTCIFCNSLVFYESTCGVHMLNDINRLLSPRYNHLVVHVGLHNHPSAKGENWKALNKMNESVKTSSEENPNASPKVFSCKLVQQEILLVKKDPIIEGDILHQCLIGGLGECVTYS